MISLLHLSTLQFSTLAPHNSLSFPFQNDSVSDYFAFSLSSRFLLFFNLLLVLPSLCTLLLHPVSRNQNCSSKLRRNLHLSCFPTAAFFSIPFLSLPSVTCPTYIFPLLYPSFHPISFFFVPSPCSMPDFSPPFIGPL